MKTLVVIAHPDVTDSTTQQFFLESSQTLDDVKNHYIETDKINIQEQQELLKAYDRIIFQFPMYWYSAPYQLKKWIDEVFDDSLMKGALKGKELGLVISLGVSEKNFAAGQSEKFTLSELFRPFEALAGKCGMIYLPILSVSLFAYLEEPEKKALLVKYQQYLTKENKSSFENEEEWFVNRLETYLKEEDSNNQMVISSILEGVKENRENLNELRMFVEEMRESNG